MSRRRQKYSQKCTQCSGQGVVNDIEQIKVKIPAGIASGQNLKLSGKGEAGRKGGGSGDLYINILVKPSSGFTAKVMICIPLKQFL
jgi:molecular chaperone DnaJ